MIDRDSKENMSSKDRGREREGKSFQSPSDAVITTKKGMETRNNNGCIDSVHNCNCHGILCIFFKKWTCFAFVLLCVHGVHFHLFVCVLQNHPCKCDLMCSMQHFKSFKRVRQSECDIFTLFVCIHQTLKKKHQHYHYTQSTPHSLISWFIKCNLLLLKDSSLSLPFQSHFQAMIVIIYIVFGCILL